MQNSEWEQRTRLGTEGEGEGSMQDWQEVEVSRDRTVHSVPSILAVDPLQAEADLQHGRDIWEA